MNTFTDGLNFALGVVQQEQAHRGAGHALDALVSVEAVIRDALAQQDKMRFYARRMNEWVEVKGEPVVIEGFEAFDFFVYNDPDSDLLWWACETSTGMAVSQRSGSKLNAIKDATFQLQKCGVEKLKASIKNALLVSGPQPTGIHIERLEDTARRGEIREIFGSDAR